MNETKKARILDDCLQAIQSGRLSEQECLNQYPHLAQELRDLMALSGKMQSHATAAPDAQSFITSKYHLLSKLPNRPPAVTKNLDLRYIWQNNQRRFTMSWVIIITTIVSLVSGAGAVYASESALPGDMLYPVKNWSENMQLRFTEEDNEFGLQLQFMDRRMQEMGELIDRGRVEDLDTLQQHYQNSTALMEQALNQVQAENPEEAVQLRTKLEEKLQEHARLMNQYLEGEGPADDALQLRLRSMLQTTTQAHERIQTHTQEQVAQHTGGDGDNQENQEQSQAQNQEQVQQQDQPDEAPPGEFYQSDEGQMFKFKFKAGMENGVYLLCDGVRYECAKQGDEVVCNVNGAPQSGNFEFFNMLTNQYLYTYEYAYNWEGDKENQPEPYQYQNEYTYGENEGGSEDSGSSSDSGETGGSDSGESEDSGSPNDSGSGASGSGSEGSGSQGSNTGSSGSDSQDGNN